MNERKVLKVPSTPKPDMTPPMDMPPAGQEQQLPPQMPDDVPQMDGGMMDEPMDGFDPGVEANEDEDPKKFIQQLTGKLSQSLRSYNSQLPRPDADLCKYVA
ncbi:MAG: hypothetical protein J6Y37_03700, partial [Paludibacteraceae bacterium]|nr:hypothetical protein [Paludibacteraceae bacterium]